MTTSVFAKETSSLFTTYDCEIVLRDKLMGGIPKDPKLIEGWLRSKAGIEDQEEVRQMMARTLTELGVEIPTGASYQEMVEASNKVAASKTTNGFKMAKKPDGSVDYLYIEDRQIKAAIKECVNILYAGELWGKTKKGPKNFTAERVFIAPAQISLGVVEPNGVELMIVHANGPSGPRSSLAYHEYVVGAVLHFEIMTLRDQITHQQWAEIWTLAQENGIGACRSQSYGKFDVTRWEAQ